MRNGLIASMALVGLQLLIEPADVRPSACPKHSKQRSAKETIEKHLALLQNGKIELAMCDYAEDAVVILPGQVMSGLDNIRTGFSGIVELLRGTVPQIQTLTTAGDVVMIRSSAAAVPSAIPDGSDMYIVRKGRIVAQTIHDTLNSAPGHSWPAAEPGR